MDRNRVTEVSFFPPYRIFYPRPITLKIYIYLIYCNVVCTLFLLYFIILSATPLTPLLLPAYMHSVCITRRRFTFHCNIFSYVSYLYYHYYITFDFSLRARKNKIDQYHRRYLNSDLISHRR